MLLSSYILKTITNGAKVKMTITVECDVSKQTLTLTRTRRHFPVLFHCISYENLHFYSQNFLCESDGSKVNRIWLLLIQFMQQYRQYCHHYTIWPGLGMPRPKAIVFIPKIISCQNHLRKKTSKSAKYPLATMLQKKVR